MGGTSKYSYSSLLFPPLPVLPFLILVSHIGPELQRVTIHSFNLFRIFFCSISSSVCNVYCRIFLPFVMFCLIPISTLLAFFAGRGFSQSTSVTLWQFGAHRLAGGGFTAPLRPIGTPNNGLSTTYLYEILDPITTVVTDNDSPVLTTSVISVERTIVASASGWIESFGSADTIQCNFISSDTGECFDATITNTGTPTPIVLGVGAAITTTSTQTTILSTTVATSPTSNSIASPTGIISTSTASSSRKSSSGAIIGGTIAGLLVACLLVFLIFWLLRRQRRSRSVSDLEKVDESLNSSSYTRPLPFTLTAPMPIQDIPRLFRGATVPVSAQSSTEASRSEHCGMITSPQTMKNDHLEHSTRTELRKEAQGAREELLSLQQASLNDPMNGDTSSNEGVTALRGRMIEVLERLRKLEEQAVDELPPTYVSIQRPNVP
ncbi:hypothetical protein J3R30DRAFT_577506 [Lentinula aciculospora]|uniref:Mid2 domain-containing protein n=1 Tax=Lentinula aciculospora TaxID=153920 RepID=A0A9W9A7F6_9AGAR|nr:hypothetical protein J3R30DRAFT_577506 [Lentinula aciculospora]